MHKQVPYIDSPYDNICTSPSPTIHCFFRLSSSVMIPEMEKPRVTEIQVRMDCNGCVQKIKKALHGINGIYELYIDFPQQKITIIGWADPEKIVKAIKKTRKTAIICSHTEPPDPEPQPPDSASQGEGSAQESANAPPESTNPGPTEGSPGEEGQSAEPPKDQPPPENPKPETKPSPEVAEASAGKTVQPPGPKDVEEVHVIYHHPPDYGYRYGYNPSSISQGYSGQWQSYPASPGFRPDPPQPIYVTHSYSTYKASPYVTGYDYIRPPTPPQPQPPPQQQYTHYARPPPPPPPPPQQQYTHYARPPPEYTHYSRPPPQYPHYSYSRPESYSEDYHYGNNSNGNITGVFSDENPNACRIV